MRTWLTRGGVLAVVHAAVAVTIAALKAADPTGWTTVEALALGALVAAAAVWAAVDAWRGLPDRGRVWVLASLVAGWGAAVLSVIGRGAFVDQTGVSALGQALTGGAAFTALLVLVPAGVGLVVGPRLDQHKGQEPTERPRPSPRPRTKAD
ncbi:B-4DMT family transporter [Actinokineospora globicatena]|uniref:B-4DMT family transporter n=1 Tax=Actinokineospora globicatena TaxID=103729 RepID=UPI0020A5C9D7|nr:B-4DMT family transporter [Actinokineospora globicatena]MCP2305697.1 hypothetical protein [Actinokineospora globicatena]